MLSKRRWGLQNQDLRRQWKGDFRIRQTPGFRFGSACNTLGDLGSVSKSLLPCLTSSRVTDSLGLWRKQDSAGQGQLKSVGGTPSSGWAVLRKLRKPTGPAPYLASLQGRKMMEAEHFVYRLVSPRISASADPHSQLGSLMQHVSCLIFTQKNR